MRFVEGNTREQFAEPAHERLEHRRVVRPLEGESLADQPAFEQRHFDRHDEVCRPHGDGLVRAVIHGHDHATVGDLRDDFLNVDFFILGV